MTVAMLTSRVDEQVKRTGSDVFAQLGYSTTQVVQLVWGFAARHADDTEAVASVLESMEDRDASDQRLDKLRKLEESAKGFEAFRSQRGIVAKHGLSDEELLEAELLEKYGR